MAQAILNILEGVPEVTTLRCRPNLVEVHSAAPTLQQSSCLALKPRSFTHVFFLPCEKEGRDNLSILDSISIPLV
jgi:hypothetical protein